MDVELSSPGAWARVWAKAHEQGSLESRTVEDDGGASAEKADICDLPADTVQRSRESPKRPLFSNAPAAGAEKGLQIGAKFALGEVCTARRTLSGSVWTPNAVLRENVRETTYNSASSSAFEHESTEAEPLLWVEDEGANDGEEMIVLPSITIAAM